MKTETVYTNDGKYLGNEYVNLSGLQTDTKKAILQLVYLDETIDYMNDQINANNV